MGQTISIGYCILVFSVQGFSVQEGKVDAKLKGYIEQSVYSSYRSRYKECIRMLNGLYKSLEKHLPESERRWRAQGGSSFLNSEH
ncbi:MAG: hypothetical protein JRJ02_13485 [Deltaproteobacteria bacterium]|nr:hypothetical protein [Deltaproteobacteria bacterium]